jgi:hypothetical protein
LCGIALLRRGFATPSSLSLSLSLSDRSVQVTAFECGGFVVGFWFSHAVADGLGAAKFMGAVGELARGVDRVSVAPTSLL